MNGPHVFERPQLVVLFHRVSSTGFRGLVSWFCFPDVGFRHEDGSLAGNQTCQHVLRGLVAREQLTP